MYGIPFDPDAPTMTFVPDGERRLLPAFPRTIEGDCFAVLKLQLLRGRLLSAHEPTRVAVVSESLAASAWPGQNPIGRKLRFGVPDGAVIEVVGVVNDSLQRSLDRRSLPQVYEAAREESYRPTSMLVRSSVPPESLFAAVRAAVRRLDPDQPVARLRTLSAIVDQTTSPRRFNLLLLGGFASVAFISPSSASWARARDGRRAPDRDRHPARARRDGGVGRAARAHARDDLGRRRTGVGLGGRGSRRACCSSSSSA
jgi:hypothetical protein